MSRSTRGLVHAVATLVLCVVPLASGCGAMRAGGPEWIHGPAARFPVDRYLTGTGQADSLDAAKERAYAAVARVFTSQITAESKDWESVWVLERRGATTTERRLSLDQLTKVSTDKMLENVSILDSWSDPRAGQHYALAGIDRAQAETALLERLAELDEAVDTALREARESQDKLMTVRNLRRAIEELVKREAYNADLRVLRPSGQGAPARYRVAELTADLERFVADHLVVAVDVSGDQSDLTRRAVSEGLIREGLSVLGHDSESGDRVTTGTTPQLLAKGVVALWPVDIPDPRFRYARWCSDFVITDVDTDRLVGAVSIGGREGHVTSREAMARAIRVMQQELTSGLARTLAGYVYGNTAPPAELPPAACPRMNGK